MLDILIPVHLPNLPLVQTCIEAIDKRTPGVPYKLWIATDGVTKADCGELEAFLAERLIPEEPAMMGRIGAYQMQGDRPQRERDWILTDWPSVYFQSLLLNMLPRLNGEWVMILPPWIELIDDRWFGKLQQPFVFDPHTALAAVPAPDSPQSTLPPAKFDRRKHPTTEAILTRRGQLQDLAPRLPTVSSIREWVLEYSRLAEVRGCTRWLSPAVRYHEIEHEQWQQPENSETPEPSSGSQSPTTTSSSSPTTTDQDGSGVSVPF